MRITVIGTGYLGAVHAACMAHLGHDVLGVDLDQGKIDALAAGRAPFYEPGLSDVLAPRSPREGFASPPRSPRPPSSATFTSSASAPHRNAAHIGRISGTCTPRSPDWHHI